MTDIVKTYNPANAAGLTPEQIEGLQNLTVDEIKQLADAYPNASYPAAYLLIIDKSKPVEKQLPTLSSFPNLYNLITRNGLKNFAALNFKGNYKPVRNSVAMPSRTTNAKRREVLDLDNTELMHLPGFKADKETIPPETVEVVKVNSTTEEKPKGKRGPKPKPKIAPEFENTEKP